MKSPRETLLNAHRHQSPDLDRIRRQVIDEELRNRQPSILEALSGWLQPKRLLWASFATAWVAIIGLNLSADVDANPAERSKQFADAEHVMEGVQRYRTQLVVLLMDEESAQTSEEVDRSDPTGPRSDATRPRRNARLQNHYFA